MKTQTSKNNTSKWNALRKLTHIINLLNYFLNLNHVTIIRIIKNDNNYMPLSTVYEFRNKFKNDFK